VTTPNSFLHDSSPANKPPRLFPAAVDVLPPVAELVGPGAEKLPQGPRRDVPHALAQPERREYLKGHAVPLAPRMLEGSLVKELDHNVLLGEELAGGGNRGSRLVIDALGVVSGSSPDTPAEELPEVDVELGFEDTLFQSGVDHDVVHLVGFVAEAAGHLDDEKPPAKGLCRGDLEEGRIRQRQDLALGSVYGPRVLVEPPRGHAAPPPSDLLELVVAEAQVAPDLVADCEPATLEVVDGASQHVLAEAEVPRSTGGRGHRVEEEGLGAVHLGEASQGPSQPPSENGLAVATPAKEADHLGVLFSGEVEPKELLDPTHELLVAAEDLVQGSLDERAGRAEGVRHWLGRKGTGGKPDGSREEVVLLAGNDAGRPEVDADAIVDGKQVAAVRVEDDAQEVLLGGKLGQQVPRGLELGRVEAREAIEESLQRGRGQGGTGDPSQFRRLGSRLLGSRRRLGSRRLLQERPHFVIVEEGNPPVRSISLAPQILGCVPHTDGRGGRLGLGRGGGEGGRAEDDDLVPKGTGRKKGLVADLVVEASGGEEVPKRQGGRERGTWRGLWERGTSWQGFREGEGLHIC